MLFKKKPLRKCRFSTHYFWFIRDKRHGIINVSGETGKLEKINGEKAVVIFDKYGRHTVPTSLVKVI